MMMIKLILLLLSPIKTQNSKVSRGFTLVEVIVAMLILSIFIVTALTALVTGLNIKLKSKLANEATLIMQQDLEKIRYQAAIYGSPTVSDTPTTASTASPLALTVPVRFSKALPLADNTLKIGNEATAYTLTTAATTTSTSMDVSANLTNISTATTLNAPLSAGATTITVLDTSKIKAGDRIVIGSATSLSTTVVKDYGNSPAGVVNINTLVPSASYTSGTPVRVLPRAGDIIDTVTNTTLYAGYCKTNTIASRFQTALGLVSLGSTVNPPYQPVPTFNGRSTYTLRRRVTVSQDPPQPPSIITPTFSVTRLQIVYNVQDTAASPNQDLSTLTAEVIPSVALQCP